MKPRIYILIFALLATFSCSNDILVSPFEFNVTTVSNTFKINEPVVFTFSGDADIVYCYPGTVGRNYEFRNGQLIDVTEAGSEVSFTTAVSGGTQQNHLSVLYSTNFNGNYSDLTQVKSATWVDITDKFTLGTSATFVASGAFDLSSVQTAGKPIYFAFKYLTRPQEANGTARNWMVQSFQVTSKKQFSPSLVISNQAYAGFRIVDQNKTNSPARSVITSTRVSLLGNVFYLPGQEGFVAGSAFNDPQSEHWAISTGIVKDKVELAPDVAVPIKSGDIRMPENYSFTYTTPGTYKAYFIASNKTINDRKDVIVSIDLTITE